LADSRSIDDIIGRGKEIMNDWEKDLLNKNDTIPLMGLLDETLVVFSFQF